MARYAATTSVPVERTRAEIEIVIKKYGATHFGYTSRPGKDAIEFACDNRMIRFSLEMPRVDDPEFVMDKRGKLRSSTAQRSIWEQACRQKWRALLLSIKAKLESVRGGISEFEQEFFAFVVNPATNVTIYESLREPLRLRYEGDRDRPLALPAPNDA